jgi:hypothetical protein
MNWLQKADVEDRDKSLLNPHEDEKAQLVRKMTRKKLTKVYINLIMRLQAELTDENDK